MRSVRILLLFLLLVMRTATAFAAPPVIEKVEPPHWWANHSHNPVRLLVRGKNLIGARVATDGNGIAVGNPRANQQGTYLLVDVTIAPNAVAGNRTIDVQTAGGKSRFDFAIEEKLPTANRFQGFSPDDIIYLILPDRFTDGDKSNNDPAKSPGLYDPNRTRYYHGGDFAGIRKRLPYLKALGITAIWMTPIYDNADIAHPTLIFDGQHNIDYHGYGATDYYGVEEHFGTLDELKQLADAAHVLGIKLIQDQVCNHVGPLHPWVDNPPLPNWFNGTKAKHIDCDWRVWNLLNPYATSETQAATLDGWFAGILPDMNQNEPEAANYLLQNSLWWIGTVGFDGIRQDTLPYVPRRFWQSWTTALKREYPKMTILGEVNEGSAPVNAFFQGGRAQFDGIDTGVDALFDYPLHYAINNAFAGTHPDLRSLPTSLANDWLYPHPELLVPFLDLHDVPCFMSLPGASFERLRMAQTFLLTTRGIPMLYFGDEIGLPGGDDPYNRRHFPGGFPNDKRDAFSSAGRTNEEEATFGHITALSGLRAELSVLRRGRTTDLLVGNEQYLFARTLPGAKTVMVAFNIADKPVTLSVSASVLKLPDGQKLRGRLGMVNTVITVENVTIKVTLPPNSSQIYVAE